VNSYNEYEYMKHAKGQVQNILQCSMFDNYKNQVKQNSYRDKLLKRMCWGQLGMVSRKCHERR